MCIRDSTEGNLLREGYAPKVDHLREIRDRGSEYLAKLEAAERERTGITVSYTHLRKRPRPTSSASARFSRTTCSS